MALIEYYIKPGGNDGLDGLSWDNAWATISHAQANVVSGDGQGASPVEIADAKDLAINSLGSLKWFYLDNDSGGGGVWHGLFNIIHIAAGTYNETPVFIFNPPAWTRWEGAGSGNTNLFMDSYNNPFVVANDYVGITGCKLGTYANMHFDLGITTDNFFIDCLTGCWIQCDWNTPGDRTNLYSNNCKAENDGLIVDFVYIAGCQLVNGTFDNLVWEDDKSWGYFALKGTGNTIKNCYLGDFIGTVDIFCADVSISDSHFDHLELWGSSGNTITDCDFVQTNPDQSYKLNILKDAAADGQQLLIDCSMKRIAVASGAQLTCDYTDRKFYETSNDLWTTITPAKSQIVVAGGSSDITFTERAFLVTTDADIAALIETWDVAGDQNKAWKVEATGARTIAFQLADMLPDTEYNLLVGGAKVSSAVSNGSGVVTFPAYGGTFSEKVFETEVSSGSVPKVMIF